MTLFGSTSKHLMKVFSHKGFPRYSITKGRPFCLCTSLKLFEHDRACGEGDIEGGVLLGVGRGDDRHQMETVRGVDLGCREWTVVRVGFSLRKDYPLTLGSHTGRPRFSTSSSMFLSKTGFVQSL